MPSCRLWWGGVSIDVAQNATLHGHCSRAPVKQAIAKISDRLITTKMHFYSVMN
jgi:hypothetical protein